jgi:hypothetical protein
VTPGRSRSYRPALAALLICAIWPVTLGLMWLATGKRVPTINLRWVPGVSDEERSETEQDLSLVWREPKEPRTVAYFLMDTNQQNLEKIVRHPLVEDTAFIDRASFVLHDPPTARTWIGDRFTSPWPAGLFYVSLFGFLISVVRLVLRD